jgi:hypothetical protein
MKTLTRKQAEKNIRAIDMRTRALADKLITAAEQSATEEALTTLTDGRFTATLGRTPLGGSARIGFTPFDETPMKQIKRNASVPRTASGKCPNTPSTQHGRAEALALYGTEQAAARIIRRQVEDMGDDLDPAVAKRALSLVADLKRGHTFQPATNYVKNPKKGVWEEVPDGNWTTTSNTINFNDALGRTGQDRTRNVTPGELNKLRALGFIINTIHPVTP